MGWTADWGRRKVSPTGGGEDSAIREGSLNKVLYVGLELI